MSDDVNGIIKPNARARAEDNTGQNKQELLRITLEMERWGYGPPGVIIVVKTKFEFGKRKSENKSSPRLLNHD